jgi:quercetin dioxygenase-like cupin family protein
MQRHEPAPIAVAQRKGMWTGGNVPLGYNVKDSQFTFSKWIMKKGAVMPLHHHANEQITWITQGETEVYSQGKKYVMHAGDIMIIPPNVPHEFRFTQDTIDIDIFSPQRQDWMEGTADYLSKE